MHCCKCHKKYNSFHASSWFKLTVNNMSNVKVNNSLYHPSYVDSEPYYLLCPWCFSEIFDKCKPYVDRIETKIIECNQPSITTYTENEPIVIKYKPNKDYEVAYINSESLNDNLIARGSNG